MKDSILRTKAIDFAADIVNFYEDFLLLKKDNTIAKQLLRSATSIGANLNEATFGNSKADFISKMHIALKESFSANSLQKHKTKKNQPFDKIFKIRY